MDLNSLDKHRILKQAPEIRNEMEDFIEKTGPDLVHAHNMHYFSPVHADILGDIKKRFGIPLVLTAHNVWPDNNRIWKEMTKRAGIWDAVIAVSHYIKKELVRSGYDDKRVTTVHHGIDLNKFAPPQAGDSQKLLDRYPEFKGRRVIFHPARLNLEKGSHISLKALDIIRKEFPDVLLVLAGTEKAVDWGSTHHRHVLKISGMIDSMALRDHVFVKFFAWDEMPLIYKAAEFSVYPSCFQEPFGLVMLESMASGKPVVVSRAGGMPEVIQNGINGFVVEMANGKQLADKCLYLLKNPHTCLRMGYSGRKMVEDNWTKEIMTLRTMQVYEETISSLTARLGEKKPV
jgi:hypothetical protein